MVYRYFSIAVLLLVVLASCIIDRSVVEGGEIRIPSGLRVADDVVTEKEAASEEDNDEYDLDWMKGPMTVEKGVKCESGMGDKKKKKKGFGRKCEGGFKKIAGVKTGARELAEDVSSDITNMKSSIMPDDKSMFVTEDAMEELISWDVDYDYDDESDEHDDVFEGEDCSSDEGCKKTVKFGGYAKLFWGCNITFSKKGKKLSKDVSCGGKSFEGIGKLEDVGYYEYVEKKK